MKKVLLLLYIALTFSGFSQTNFRFADSTAQWNVLSIQSAWCHCVYYNTQVYSVSGDTVIKNQMYQNLATGFIRKDSTDKVYKRTIYDTIEYLIYDFSKHQGDTLRLNLDWGWDIFCAIDSVDTIVLDKPRKRIFVTYNQDQWKQDQWIEGIGSLRSHFLEPGVDHTIVDGASYTLLCFYQDGNLVYHDTAFQSCVMDTVIYMGLAKVSTENAIRISPNPATTYLTIQLQQNLTSSTAFQLYDITGRMVLQKPLTAPTTRVELSGVSKGMYLYNVVLRQAQHDMQQVGAGKVVVE